MSAPHADAVLTNDDLFAYNALFEKAIRTFIAEVGIPALRQRCLHGDKVVVVCHDLAAIKGHPWPELEKARGFLTGGMSIADLKAVFGAEEFKAEIAEVEKHVRSREPGLLVLAVGAHRTFIAYVENGQPGTGEA